MKVYQLRGSIAALVTPMHIDGRLDFDAWQKLLDWHVQAGTHGIVVAGTTGESACLNDVEIGQLLKLAVEQFATHGPVLCGIGSPSTATSVKLADIAADNGADALLAVTPYYNRPPQTGLVAHYQSIAAHSDLPVVLYNVPSRTGVDLLPSSVSELAEVDSIVGLKEANNDSNRLPELQTVLVNNKQFVLLSGDDDSCCYSMLHGMQGVISVASNIVPNVMRQLCEFSLEGNQANAEAIERKLKNLFAMLGWEGNPIAVKWSLYRQGLISKGIRQPLVWLSDAAQTQAEPIIEAVMQLEAQARRD